MELERQQHPKKAGIRALGGAAVSLAIGGVLYLGRSPTRLEDLLGLELRGLRATLGPFVRALPAWVRGVGPDAAWSFALGAVLAVLVGRGWAGFAWRCAGLALAVGYELGQVGGLVPGTFDPADLVGIVIAYGAATLWARPPSTSTLWARPPSTGSRHLPSAPDPSTRANLVPSEGK